MNYKTILISIKPKYVEQIFKGNKKVEFRKRFSDKHITKGVLDNVGMYAFIYETAPTSKIVGHMYIHNAWKGSPTQIWKENQARAGITKKEYFNYYKGCKEAIGLAFTNVERYDKPVPLSKIGLKRPPQSYQFIKKEKLKLIAIKENT